MSYRDVVTNTATRRTNNAIEYSHVLNTKNIIENKSKLIG